jgi:hypothetical protein
MDDMTDDATTLPTHTVSAADRLQRFHEDDEALAELAEVVHKRAMAENESANPAGHLDLRIRERRAAMWGYDSPQRFDMVMVGRSERPSSHDQMMTTIKRFLDQAPPAQKALRQRLQELSPEKALELLGLPKPVDGDGGAPLAPADDNPSR